MDFMKKVISPLVATIAGASAEPIDIGTALPDVSVQTHLGETINLKDFADKRYTLVYFYPKADTPGCTKQACSLRDVFADLGNKGITVFGVSKDSVEDQKKFAEKFNLPFPLLADTEAAIIKAFGVPTMPVIGMAKRQAFLFKEGKLVWRDLEASTEEQAKDVLAQIVN